MKINQISFYASDDYMLALESGLHHQSVSRFLKELCEDEGEETAPVVAYVRDKMNHYAVIAAIGYQEYFVIGMQQEHEGSDTGYLFCFKSFKSYAEALAMIAEQSTTDHSFMV